MATTPHPKEGEFIVGLDHFIHRGNKADIPSLACHAAIELDGLLKGISDRLDAIQGIAMILSDKETTGGNGPVHTFLLDPSTSVMMNQAIVDSRLASEPMTEDEELVSWTDDISGRLTKLVSEAKSDLKDAKELERMRDFCLALSKRAFESEGSVYEDDVSSRWG